MSIELPEFVKFMGLPMLGAFIGTVARSQKWRYPDDLKMADGKTPDPRAGKWNRIRACTEMIAAPAIGMMVAGVGKMFNLDPIVLAGLGAAVGLIGAASLGEIVTSAAQKRIDSFIGGLAK